MQGIDAKTNPYIEEEKDLFISKNMRLVHSVCKKYINKINSLTNISYDDVVSEGCIGLLKAYDRYDPNKVEGITIKFSTYAVPMIQGEIQRMLRDNNPGPKFSRSAKEIQVIIHRMELQDATAEEILETLRDHLEATYPHRNHLNIVKDGLDYIHYHKPRYLEEVIYTGDNEDLTLGDQLSVSVDFTRGINIKEFLSQLPERMVRIILMVVDGKTQREIGEIMGISQVQVSRLQEKIFIMADEFGQTGKVTSASLSKKEVDAIRERKEQEEKEGEEKLVKKNQSRTDQAIILLRTTDQSVSQIARTTGLSWPTVDKHAKDVRGGKEIAAKVEEPRHLLFQKVKEQERVAVKTEEVQKPFRTDPMTAEEFRELVDQVKEKEQETVMEEPKEKRQEKVEDSGNDIFEQNFSTRVRKEASTTDEFKELTAKAADALCSLGISNITFDLTIKSR